MMNRKRTEPIGGQVQSFFEMTTMQLLVVEHGHTKLCGERGIDPDQLLVRHGNLYGSTMAATSLVSAQVSSSLLETWLINKVVGQSAVALLFLYVPNQDAASTEPPKGIRP